MAHYRASIDTQHSREDAFAYLSDFSTTREWDPSVVEAERVNGQAVGEGTEFRLVAEFLGRKNELTYRIVEYEPPHAVTFLGENATVVSRDPMYVAFDMDEDKLEASIAQLQAAGVHVSVPVVVNHDDSPMGVSKEMNEGVWVRSVYFRDPNGIMLEYAARLRGFRPGDVAHPPARAVTPAAVEPAE